MHQAVSTLSWEKNSHHHNNNKNPCSQQLTAFVEIPQGGKSEQDEKKKKNEPTLSHQYFLEPEAVLDLPGSPRQLSFV